jgi:tRNA A37 methylthiotransferase MiaB
LTTKLKSYVEEFQFEDNNLVVYTIGCPMGIADGEKMFNKMKGQLTDPTIIVLVCNVVEWHTMLSRKRIIELKEKYPTHKVFITGCINDVIGEKFERLGTLVFKKDMWNVESYRG